MIENYISPILKMLIVTVIYASIPSEQALAFDKILRDTLDEGYISRSKYLHQQRAELEEIITSGKANRELCDELGILLIKRHHYSPFVLNEARAWFAFCPTEGLDKLASSDTVDRSNIITIGENRYNQKLARMYLKQLEKDKDHAYPHTIVFAQLAKATLDRTAVEVTTQVDKGKVRSDYMGIFVNPATDPQTKWLAFLYLTEMDILGEGILEPDYKSARWRCQSIIRNSDFLPHIKSRAHSYLAEMDREGKGIPEPDYISALSHDTEVLACP